MNIDRRLIVQSACIVAAPILYIAASGPAILFAWKCGPQRMAYVHGVYFFYRPLLKLSSDTCLEQPLCGYLRLWGLYPYKVAGKVGTQQHGTLSFFPFRVAGKTGTAQSLPARVASTPPPAPH